VDCNGSAYTDDCGVCGRLDRRVAQSEQMQQHMLRQLDDQRPRGGYTEGDGFVQLVAGLLGRATELGTRPPPFSSQLACR
jgi:glutamate synthase domain-containing protein 1